MFCCVSAIHSFLFLLSSVLVYEYTTICYSILMVDRHLGCIVFGMKIKMLRTFWFTSFCGHMFSFIWGKNLGVELLGHTVKCKSTFI